MSKTGIERLLAERFPRTDVLAWVGTGPASSDLQPAAQHAPGHVEDALTPGRLGEELQHAPGHVGDRPRVNPPSSQSFAVQFTMSRSAHDKLRYAQELLGHQIPSGDIVAVFERALDALIEKLEKRKFASTSRTRPSRRPSTDPRHIPAHVKRAVWNRDGGQCTFVSEAGRRCPARKLLEFDHVVEVARGGEATVAGIRLRCRAHNQYAAERTFGAEFMRQKREEARRAAEARRRASEARARARAAAEEVIAPLRALGFRAHEAHCAAALCEAIPDAPLEQRVRHALSYFQPRLRTAGQVATSLRGAP
jgi:5-methylcytosine-specific restriction endonuclease McrA